MKRVFFFFSLFFAFHSLFAQWQPAGATSGNIYYNGGNVGIGVSNPSFKFEVNGSCGIHSGLVVDMPNSGISAWIRAGANTPAGLVLQGNVTSSSAWSAWWLTGANGYLQMGTNGGSPGTMGVINIDVPGHVGINTLNTSGYTFNCAGTAVFDGVTVKNFSGNNPKATPWADYVFQPSYALRPIDSLDAYIKVNKHLPGIPTSAEVQQNGIDLAANQVKLLEKIEEITLYTIELQKQIDLLKARNESLAHTLQKVNHALAAKPVVGHRH